VASRNQEGISASVEAERITVRIRAGIVDKENSPMSSQVPVNDIKNPQPSDPRVPDPEHKAEAARLVSTVKPIQLLPAGVPHGWDMVMSINNQTPEQFRDDTVIPVFEKTTDPQAKQLLAAQLIDWCAAKQIGVPANVETAVTKSATATVNKFSTPSTVKTVRKDIFIKTGGQQWFIRQDTPTHTREDLAKMEKLFRGVPAVLQQVTDVRKMLGL
jgi:hypothetical protein